MEVIYIKLIIGHGGSELKYEDSYFKYYDIMDDFEELLCHDQVIKDIIVDRNNPGYNDTIRFVLCDEVLGDYMLIFSDVYWADLSMNFGVVAPETVYAAYVTENDIQLDKFRQMFGHILKDNIKKYNLYVIEFNSTGSIVKIIAKNVLKERIKSTFNFSHR